MIEVASVNSYVDALNYTYEKKDRDNHLIIMSALYGYLHLETPAQCRLALHMLRYVLTMPENKEGHKAIINYMILSISDIELELTK